MDYSNKKTILIKISGGCLQPHKIHDLYDAIELENLCFQIKELHKNYNIGIVVGGGNLWRGKSNYLKNLQTKTAHYVGMLATMMNGLVLHDYLKAIGVKATVFSALTSPQFCFPHNHFHVQNQLENNYVLIFTAGTGLPFVSTDTASAVRAAEIGAEYILMGKDNIQGVYDSDPKKNKNAIFYPELQFDEMLEKNLMVMDLAAVSLCKENNIKILVFNQAVENAFIKALKNEIILTKIY